MKKPGDNEMITSNLRKVEENIEIRFNVEKQLQQKKRDDYVVCINSDFKFNYLQNIYCALI